MLSIYASQRNMTLYYWTYHVYMPVSRAHTPAKYAPRYSSSGHNSKGTSNRITTISHLNVCSAMRDSTCRRTLSCMSPFTKALVSRLTVVSSCDVLVVAALQSLTCNRPMHIYIYIHDLVIEPLSLDFWFKRSAVYQLSWPDTLSLPVWCNLATLVMFVNYS